VRHECALSIGHPKVALLRTALFVLIGATVAIVAVAIMPSRAGAGPALRIDNPLPSDWINTPSGPLGPADRDLLVRVRLAGLWEAPAGDMAQSRAGTERVKVVGHHLRADHLALDAQVRAVAAKLGVGLPDEPNADQKGWLNELSNSKGAVFDQIFPDRLRAAHGKVFSVVAAVRAATRNDAIRAFAQTAVAAVMKHMTLLEGIGLVDWAALPTAAVAPAVAPASASLSTRSASGINPNLVWLVLGIAAIVGLISAARVVRPR
jgi:predicted outer membrane protein